MAYMVKVDKAVASLRVEIGDKVAALRERMVDAVENRPAFDPSQVDRIVEATVARVLSEARGERARELEAYRREFSEQIGCA